MSRQLSAITLACAAALSLPCAGQELTLAGPSLGLVFDQPTRSLRMILGLPGAARLGDPVASEIEWAAVSPSGRAALLLREGQLSLLVPGGDAQAVPVTGSVETPSLAAWTSDSSALALYLPASRAIQWISVEGSAARAEWSAPLPALDGPVTGIIADAASRAAFVSIGGSGVFLITAAGEANSVAAVPGVAAFAYDPVGRTLWVADRVQSQVLQFDDPAAGGPPRTLLADAPRLSDVTALALSSDRKSLYLADRATRRLYTLPLREPALSEGIELDEPATSFRQVGRPAVLLLGSRKLAGDPLYVLDETTGPQVFFIPAGDGR